MSKVALVAKLQFDPEKTTEVDSAIAALTAAADEEPGLEIYSAHRDAGEPSTVWMFELYTDAAALDAHGKGDKMKAAMGALGAFLTGRPEIMRCDPLSAKGLAL